MLSFLYFESTLSGTGKTNFPDGRYLTEGENFKVVHVAHNFLCIHQRILKVYNAYLTHVFPMIDHSFVLFKLFACQVSCWKS